MTSSTINGSVESLNSAVAFITEQAEVKQRRTTDLNVAHDKKATTKNPHLHPENMRVQHIVSSM